MAAKSASTPGGHSSAMEDYLEAILGLIDTKGFARVVDIAAQLGISQASVTNMVQRLDAEGLLRYEKYRGLALTDEGENVAKGVVRRHRLLEDFLTVLGVDAENAGPDVEGMEHHIGAKTLEAIERLTAYLQSHPEVARAIRCHKKAP